MVSDTADLNFLVKGEENNYHAVVMKCNVDTFLDGSQLLHHMYMTYLSIFNILTCLCTVSVTVWDHILLYPVFVLYFEVTR